MVVKPFSRNSNRTFVFSRPMEDYRMQKDHAMEVNPVDTNFLTNTFVEKKRGSRPEGQLFNLWDHIQTYKVGMYYEKTLLIDPKVSAIIGDAIEKHSERGPDTKFIDADAGLCLVTKELMQRNLFPSANSHIIFEKDPLLDVLNRRAKENYLTRECKKCSVSLVKSVVDFHNINGFTEGNN